jgi:hypothetical protein
MKSTHGLGLERSLDVLLHQVVQLEHGLVDPASGIANIVLKGSLAHPSIKQVPETVAKNVPEESHYNKGKDGVRNIATKVGGHGAREKIHGADVQHEPKCGNLIVKVPQTRGFVQIMETILCEILEYTCQSVIEHKEQM